MTFDCKRMAANGHSPPPEPEEEPEAAPAAVVDEDRQRRRCHAELLSRLQRYRPWLPESFCYYAVGHDIAMSALSGRRPRGRNVFRDPKIPHIPVWCETDRDDDKDVEQRLKLTTMMPNERQNLNFFFGGCGDCRHVYTTLYDLGRQLPTVQGTPAAIGNRVHLLLNDSSPAIIARNAIMLFALYDLARFSRDEVDRRTSSQVVNLLTMLHHGWLSVAVPSYVNEMILDTINTILARGPRGFPNPSIIISDGSWPAVGRVLVYWKTLISEKSDVLSQEAIPQLEHYLAQERQFVDKSEPERVAEIRARLQREFANAFGCFVPNHHQMQQFWDMLDHAVYRIIIMTREKLETLQIYPDLLFFALFGVAPPAMEYLHFHHPETFRIYKEMCELCETSVGDLVADTARAMARLVSQAFDLHDVMSDYMMNVTAREPLLKPGWQTDPEGAVARTQDPAEWDTPYILSRVFHCAVFQPPKLGRPSMFNLSWSLWSTAADGVRSLVSEPRSSCVVEMIVGDMNDVAHDLSLAAEERQARNLPTRMLRAFISNVQDYTGLMLPLINLSRVLLPSPKAFIRCNQMYNIHWRDCGHWAKTMLAVSDVNHIGPVFGAWIMPHSRIDFFTWLGKQLGQGADLDPALVRTILQRVFIGVAFPPSQQGCSLQDSDKPNRFEMHFENLSVLVELIISLLERGFSRATMSEIVAEMLNDNLHLTNPRPPQLGADVLEPAEVPVRPFLAELSALLILFKPVFDLPMELPNNSLQPSPDTVCQHTLYWATHFSNVSPGDAQGLTLLDHVGLVIAPNKHLWMRPRKLAFLGSVEDPVYFFSVLELSQKDRTVKFWISHPIYEEMKVKRYYAVLYSTESYQAITEPMQLL